jgi:hypothetical protein
MLLALVLGFFRLGVDDPAPDAPDSPPADPAPDPQPELDLGGADDEPPPQGDTPTPAGEDAEREALRRTAQLERERADRLEREAMEARARNRGADSEFARQQAEEERILADPQADANEKWRIQANRRIRATESTAAQMAFQSQDASDRANFSIACSTNKRLAFVKDKVEEEIVRMRQNGQNAPRESVAYFLLGKMAANAKPKGAPKAPAAPGPRGGKTAGVKSDVPAKGSMTEREKRRARLENVNI